MNPASLTSSVYKHSDSREYLRMLQMDLDHLRKLRIERNPDFIMASEKLLLEARRKCDLAMYAGVLFEQSVFHNNVTSQYELSNRLASKALGIASKTGLTSLQADALRMIGVNYNFLGEFVKASEVFNKGIVVLSSIPNMTPAEKRILAGIYFNLVSLYKDFDMDETRIQYIDKTFQLYSEIGDKQGVARTYIMYASFYPGIKGTEKVTEYYQKAMQLFKEMNDYRGMGNSLMNLGNHYCGQNDFDKGMPLLMEGIEYVKRSGSVVYIINGIINLAIALRRQGKYAEAIQHFEEVENRVRESNTTMNLTGLYEEWSLALEESGDPKGALEVFKRFHHQRESANKSNKTAALSETKVKLELEMRKKESESLREKNAEMEAYSRKIEISNFELKQFAHVASHDLKEPLHMVSSYMQLLEKRIGSRLSDEEREFLAFAKDGAKRMYGLINSLLTLSKINNETIKEEVDLNLVLEEVKDMLQLEIERKNFTIDTCKLPVVTANKTQMHQLFQNLVSNAMKYNQSPEPRLQISCLAVEGFFHFSFSDNGIGIAEKYRNKVFEIFQRLHTGDEYAGTGIGLTICKKIVEQMGGDIRIEDSKFGGSDFRFTLPV